MLKHTLLAIPFTLFTTSCAIDSMDDQTSTAEGASTTVLDNCAVDKHANASLDIMTVTETYTRKGDPKINYDCECKAWQKDAFNLGEAQADINHPTCRPQTFVDMKWEVWYPVLAWEVKVPSWSLTNGETECNNSKLEVTVLKETSPGDYTFQYSTSAQPHWSNGICGSLSITGSGTADGWRRRIKAVATRGLDEFNHGFETVKFSGYTYNF